MNATPRTGEGDIGSLRVWVVSDGRPANENQCLGLAEAVGAVPEVFRLDARHGWHRFLDPVRSAAGFGLKGPPWPDLLIAATGDDEDNIIICQLAREKYGVNNVIARINDPRNQPYFDLLGISPTVSATGAIMGLIEHEVPDHGLIRMLELRKENLEIVELTIDETANAKGKRVGSLRLPEGARIISVVRDGTAEIPDEQTQLHIGDQVLAILEPGKEDELRRVLLRD